MGRSSRASVPTSRSTSRTEPRSPLGRLSGERLAQAAARLPPRPDVATDALRRLGKRVQRPSREGPEAERALAQLLAEVAPDRLDEYGVGPVCGAQPLVSSDDPSRITSEASFAALAGTSPVEASSGKQRRHRLNRGGDRQLNWALHAVALQRIRHHLQTSAYHQRLPTTGKTPRKHAAASKRALPRHLYPRPPKTPKLPLPTHKRRVR